MNYSKIIFLTLAFSFCSISKARLPDSSGDGSKVSRTRPGTTLSRNDALFRENMQICADQGLKIIEGIGGNTDEATEFRLFMSIKCENKAKGGLFFGAKDPGEKAERVVDLLKEIYPRVTTPDGQRRVRNLIKTIQQQPEYPREASLQTSEEATAR